ncbi:hypothetical protein J2755_000057 [Methanohalophilus levihalophilus]|uniref:hypothetical protein n=1 Tax=Methanohalophilus levihalophilus TaxID=1431282 RepID=UPI001AE42FCF|nr:hypothetical protein [Methanohalophilus levihalophilus]MBP2029137.1 hypothetical protein [Methanohalophilus levihalophilus]
MKKILVALSIFILFASATASAELVDDIEVSIAEYNAYSGEVPSVIKSLFGNEIGHVTIGTVDGSPLYFKIVTKNAKVVEFREITADEDVDATLLLEIHENTLEDILTSESPMSTYFDAYESGKITIEAIGIKNQVSLTLGNAAIKLSKFIGF